MVAGQAERGYRVGVLIFLGLLVVAGVLGYWLRRIYRALVGTLAVQEAALNRAARNRGEAQISDDIDKSRLF